MSFKMDRASDELLTPNNDSVSVTCVRRKSRVFLL